MRKHRLTIMQANHYIKSVAANSTVKIANKYANKNCRKSMVTLTLMLNTYCCRNHMSHIQQCGQHRQALL